MTESMSQPRRPVPAYDREPAEHRTVVRVMSILEVDANGPSVS